MALPPFLRANFSQPLYPPVDSGILPPLFDCRNPGTPQKKEQPMKAALPIAWIFLLLTFPLLADDSRLPPSAQIQVDFKQHVRPILEQKCYACHGPKQQQSGLRLDDRQLALRGGDYGPVI